MSLPKEFVEQLPMKADADLYDMLTHQEDYLPEALTAAKEQLTKRNLPPERIAQIEAAAQAQRASAEVIAQERLGWPMRIFLFLFFAGIFGAVLAAYYNSKGYKKKASDCWVTMIASLAFHAVVTVSLYCLR
jgi:hypothetical protein